MDIERADFSQLHEMGYGVGFHWTTRTLPQSGPPVPYQQAVEEFDVDRFVEQIAKTGAGHVLLTTTHADHFFAAPHTVIENILPGRTCERDLIMEIADALAQRDIKLMLYYHHGLHGGDGRWEAAVGAMNPKPDQFYQNLCDIIMWTGEHYGEKVIAFWFDAGYALATQRFSDMPWQRVYEAAKADNPDRLITWNSGIHTSRLYTRYQDYWAGEVIDLRFRPSGPLNPHGLPWYAFATWHSNPDAPTTQAPVNGQWGIFTQRDRRHDWQQPPIEAIAAFINSFRDVGGTVTINLLCYQDGTILDGDLNAMQQVAAEISD